MISLVIPVRDWPAERLVACIDSFSATDASLLDEILVVDFGSTEPVKVRRGRRFRVVRVETETWSLAEAINVGVASARNEFIAKVDADVILAPESVGAFEERLRELAGGAGYGLGLSSAVDLPPGIGAAEAWQAVSNGEQLSGMLRPRWSQGLLVMFARGDWLRVGGYDSRYVGWGNEDNDFAERMRRSGRRVDWIAPDAIRLYHVAHPPSHLSPKGAALRRKNQALATSDKSVYRPLVFRHSESSELSAPAVLNRLTPHVTLAIASKSRPGRDRMTVEAVQSFRGQIDNDFEVIVVDNGSTETEHRRLAKQLRAIEGLPAMHVELSDRASIPAARNRITDLARGRYICVVDDDDLALSNRLADHLAPFAKDSSIHGTHGGWIDFDEDTGQIERNPARPRRLATLLVGRGKITAHPASLYRADVLRAVRYDESLALGSDLDLALRMAALGLTVAHTGSFLTLRRFHASNVTVTGTTDQILLGTRSRDRLWASFARRHQNALQDDAKTGDPDEFCGNNLTLEEIAALIPPYAGEWRLALPLSSLMSESSPGQVDADKLGALINRHGGEIDTMLCGIDQPLHYLSNPIKGAQKALRAIRTIDTTLGVRARLVSATQHAQDRAVPISWAPLFTQPDHVLLRSRRFDSAEDILELLSTIDPSSILRASIHSVADADETGPCHYLISGPHVGPQFVQTSMQTLAKLTRIPFDYVRANGLGNPLLLGDKVH